MGFVYAFKVLVSQACTVYNLTHSYPFIPDVGDDDDDREEKEEQEAARKSSKNNRDKILYMHLGFFTTSRERTKSLIIQSTSLPGL